jgi:hypothetical protein
MAKAHERWAFGDGANLDLLISELGIDSLHQPDLLMAPWPLAPRVLLLTDIGPNPVRRIT